MIKTGNRKSGFENFKSYLLFRTVVCCIRVNQRKERREKIERKKCLKTILKKNKIRKLRETFNHWHGRTQNKIKQREFLHSKLQTICGSNFDSPEFSSQDEEEEEEMEEEEEGETCEDSMRPSPLLRFKSLVNQVITNIRNEEILQEMMEKQKERENCTHQFLADDESSLYRSASPICY